MSASSEQLSAEEQPVLFIGHGGGPFFLMDGSGPMKTGDKNSRAASELRSLWDKVYADGTVAPPKAILVISAHWESSGSAVQVLDNQHQGLLFDYFGFPPETYQYEYKAPNVIDLNKKVVARLNEAGIDAELTTDREGLDHGVFIPLLVLYPKADIPVVQVSLGSSLDAETHLALGEALEPLRKEGVLIIGSGMLTHNMRERGVGVSEDVAEPWAASFQSWVDSKLNSSTLSASAKRQAVLAWESAPNARRAHPREEHLLPFFVSLAAAGYAAGTKPFQTWMASTFSLNAYVWRESAAV